ncbi:hypothetical protein B0H13DRAFT_2369234 [Mycena leptocephala]|nr:hypothetical protein B0H13DRAFT_2369234 [Mycena leptocephala]
MRTALTTPENYQSAYGNMLARRSAVHGRLVTSLSDGISVGVMSPQMLQGRRIGKLLNDPEFKVLVGWMLIDEAHVLDEDSGTFREPYRSILHMRPRVPATPAAALGFRTGQYVNARYTIDRPNIKYIPRFFQHPTSGFEFMDFSFVVPFEMKFIHDILLTLIL